MIQRHELLDSTWAHGISADAIIMGSTNKIHFLHETVLHKTHVRSINFDIVTCIARQRRE
jgi:hypothetical protein